jgi:hypothetical protein
MGRWWKIHVRKTSLNFLKGWTAWKFVYEEVEWGHLAERD